MSCQQAFIDWRGRDALVRSPSYRGGVEDAANAYKVVNAVFEAALEAQLACMVAHLGPWICVKR